MRKSIKISGVVAGLAVALAPIAAFADTPTRTDTLNVTVNESCTVNNVDAETGTLELANTYDATVNSGAVAAFSRRDNAVEAKFTIFCNYATGYKIVANSSTLDGADTENAGVKIYGGTAIDGDTSFWGAKVETTGNLTSDAAGSGDNDVTNISGTNVKVAHNNAGSAAAGDTFSVSYKVGAARALKAGRYTGQVAYTLVEGAE